MCIGIFLVSVLLRVRSGEAMNEMEDFTEIIIAINILLFLLFIQIKSHSSFPHSLHITTLASYHSPTYRLACTNLARSHLLRTHSSSTSALSTRRACLLVLSSSRVDCLSWSLRATQCLSLSRKTFLSRSCDFYRLSYQIFLFICLADQAYLSAYSFFRRSLSLANTLHISSSLSYLFSSSPKRSRQISSSLLIRVYNFNSSDSSGTSLKEGQSERRVLWGLRKIVVERRAVKCVQSIRFYRYCSLPRQEWHMSQVQHYYSFQSTRTHKAILLGLQFFQGCQNQRVTPICSSPYSLKQLLPFTSNAHELLLYLSFSSPTYTCTGSATFSKSILRSFKTRVYLCLSLNISAHSVQNLFFTNEIKAFSLSSLGMQASRSQLSNQQMFMLVQTPPFIGLL